VTASVRPGGRPEGADAHGFAVASVLLDAAGWTGRTRWLAVAPGTDARSAAAAGRSAAAGSTRTAVLALAEGTARRTEKAPGHLDERAAGFDADLLAAVRTGIGAVLDVDPALAADLWVHGLAAWQALAGALARTTDGATTQGLDTVLDIGLDSGLDTGLDVRWSGDPFGVLYVVAGTR